MRRRRGRDRDRLEPGARRGRDHARDRGGGVPRLQRERRPAVGAELPAVRGGAGRDQPGQGQRGSHRRSARRRRGQDHARAGGERRHVCEARPEAGDADQAAAGRLQDHRQATLGARPQVHRGDERRPRPRATRTGPDASERGRPSLSSSTTSSTCSTSATRKGEQQNLRGFGDAFAGRGTTSTLRIQALVPLVRVATPVLTTIAGPRPTSGASSPRRPAQPRSSAPVAVQQAQLWVNLDLTLAAFADVARPFLQDTITKGPGVSRPRSTRSR